MAGSSNSDGLVFDGRRYLKGKEAETLQAGGLLEAVPSKSGWDYRLTQEGRALAKVMARSRDAAADGKSAGKAQSARAKDTPVAGKAAVAKNATTEKPPSDKVRNIEAGKSHFDGGKGKSAAAQGAADEMPSEKTGKAKPETFVKTALDNPEEAERKARVLQGEPVYTVKERTAPRENKALREWAVALFDKAGNKAVNPEIGEVALTAKSVKDSLAHGISPEKASAFEAVPYVVEKGAVIVRTRHGRVSSYFISAPVEIEGKQDIVTVLVHHDVNKKRMYLHSVTTKENLLKTALAGYDGDSTADAEASEPRGKLYSGDIASVLKKLLKYKTQGGKTENTPSEGLRFSRPAKKTDGGHSGSFGETARRYGGEAAYRQAEKDGKTVLSYRRWVQVRTPEFKAWFGDWENNPDNASKVVNPKTGEPLVVYHYTEEQFDTFNLNKARQSSDIPAFFFTTDPEMGMEYGSHEMQVFLNIRNPANKPVISSGKDGKALREELVQNGFDGTVVDDSYDGHLSIEYAALRPNQIKSATDNTGAFDSGNDDIRFSLDESPDSAFARAVDDAARGRQVSGYVRVGTTPDVLKMLGLPDVRVTVHGSMFKKVMGGKHSVTAEDLKQIPKQINSPVAVMKSETMADGYVVLTELVEHERGTDKPVVAALHLKRTKDGLELMNIASVYGRRDIQVQRGLNSHLLYLDKEKGLKLSRTFGLQLPAYVQEGSNLGSQVKTDSDLAQYLKAEKQGKFDKKQENAKQHAESIKKRLAESIGGLAEQVDVAAVSETAPDKAQMLLSERVEGWFDGRTGKITLVAENLTPERAVWVAWHELGHRGFAAEGFAKYREELERADGNSLIRRIADAVQEEREGTGDAAASVRSAAVEEAVVELYAAQRTGDWSGIENRYGVKVGNGLKRGIAGVLARIGAVLRRVLQRLAGKADGAMSDADVFAMLADLHGNAEGARDASSDGVKPSRSAMKDTDVNIRRGRAAMNRALVEKADVRRAMYRNDIGWIDFVWGSTGRVLPNGKTKGAMGLAHVIESRMRKDGMSRDEVVGMLTNDIVEAIARGKVYKHVVNGNSERLQLRHNGYEANLIKNAGNNAWLITGYELYQNGADGVGFDTSAATHTTPTPARRDVGASDTPNVRAKDESVNTADGTRFSRAEERSKSESLEKLRRAETIRISGREIPEGGNLREYKRNALEYGKSLRGSYVNKDTGREITLGASGVKEVLQHDYKDAEHLQSIAAIPQIIENAVYIDTLPNEDGKVPHIKEFEYYLAGLNIGGTDYTVRAAVGVSDFGDRYYDHKLTQIEKGKLLEARHSDNKSGVPQQQNALGNFDDKRLLQILQDKNAGKGGIADFDTEAVRFSRAANIGAAISHITGKRSDLRNALKDRWDASKGIQLQFLGRRQIEDIYGGDLDGLKEYGRLSELFGADANKAVTEADKVVKEWGRLKKADAKALADLMHDATLAKVDADPLKREDAQKRLDGIRTALDIADGKIEKAKAVIASADARIARADAAYDKASEAAKKAQSALLAAEEKAGREILADEADMRLRRLFYADSEAKRALRHFNKI